MTFQVLLIGLGNEVLGAATEDSRVRHLRYAEGVDHLHMIVWGRRGRNPISLSPKLTVYPVGQGGRLSYMSEALQVGEDIVHHWQVSVISTQDPFYTAAIGLRLCRFGPRLQIQNHSDFFDNKIWLTERPLWNKVLNSFGKWAARRADRLRVVNTSERNKYVALGVPTERIDVLPVPVDFAIFEKSIGVEQLAALRRRWQIAPDSPVLFWVGRPVPFKDLGTLLRALSIVHRQRPDVVTIIGGGFSGAPEWPALARDLGLADVVRFVGPIGRDELPAYFALCSAYLHSSMYEGFGRVMVEAGAAGQAVVATQTAGALDIVRDGETGLLCPPRDPEGLADSVLRLLSDPGRARRMGEAARRWVKEQFDPGRLTQGIVSAWHATANL